ncbi:MAG: cupin domain-containing protein [Kiritimatiellae bacterium]|nr:cupin domain-containing protein [Kiritimatiellia bacterium]
MIAVKARDVKGYVAQEPYRRTLKCLISPRLQDVRHVAVGMVLLPPGSRSTPHPHRAEEETWYVVSGTGRITIGEETAALEPDMLVVAPPGETHFIVNDGNETLKMLWIFTPPGPEAEHIRE